MTIKKWTTYVLAAVLGVALGASDAAAQSSVQPLGDQQQAEEHQQPSQRTANYGATSTGRLDQATSAKSIRASTLIGKAIENPVEESVGEVSDIVLDAKTGKIEYVAVTYGGFLGMGNKMFAVPYQAFQVRQNPRDPDDPNNYVLVLNVTKKTLEGAQGFDENNWPDSTDPNFTKQIRERYGVMESKDERDHSDRQSDAIRNPSNNYDTNRGIED